MHITNQSICRLEWIFIISIQSDSSSQCIINIIVITVGLAYIPLNYCVYTVHILEMNLFILYWCGFSADQLSPCNSSDEGDSEIDSINDDLSSNLSTNSGSKRQKRGILPKQATSVMRAWLFQHLVVSNLVVPYSHDLKIMIRKIIRKFWILFNH